MTGKQLFKGAKHEEVLDANKKPIDFSSNEFKNLDKTGNIRNLKFLALELLKKMLEKDPKKRYSA